MAKGIGFQKRGTTVQVQVTNLHHVGHVLAKIVKNTSAYKVKGKLGK